MHYPSPQTRLIQTAALGLVLSAAAVLGGCPGTLDNKEEFQAATGGSAGGGSCPDIETELLPTSCAISGCHDAVGMASGLDLESPDIGSRLVGVMGTECQGLLVDAANPEQSLMYTKCQASNTCGTQMPQIGEKLSATELECLLAWIQTL